MKVIIICDGASRGNPGPGGWGVVVASERHVEEKGGYVGRTTNNKMELTAAIEGLGLVPAQATAVAVYTDSTYVKKGITEWVNGWTSNNWMTSQKKPVENVELWQALVDASALFNIEWHVIPGHAGIPANERVDDIATAYATGDAVSLYDGTRKAYEVSLDLSPAVIAAAAKHKKAQLPSKSKSASSRKAFSYISVIGGVVQTHKTWDECKDRVHGKAAKFKKVFSAAEEQALVREWSV